MHFPGKEFVTCGFGLGRWLEWLVGGAATAPPPGLLHAKTVRSFGGLRSVHC